VVEAIHAAGVAAGLETPVIVGHSLGAMAATVYAAEHPVAGIVNVDAPMHSEPFARLVQSLEPQLRGDGFQRVWSMFRASMHAERLPAAMRELLRAGDDVSQALVLSYWRPLLESFPEEAAGWTEALLACIRAAGVPYLAIFSEERGPAEAAWLAAQLPDAEIAIWAVVHHFPHLADPVRFAALLTGFAAHLPELERR
jgi:pimeloyl-ACP methyl ester carboxylesterase